MIVVQQESAQTNETNNLQEGSILYAAKFPVLFLNYNIIAIAKPLKALSIYLLPK